MAYNANSSDPYLSAYDTPSQGFFGTTEFIILNAADGLTLTTNYAAKGGYTNYKLKFSSSSFISVSQPSGGMMDYYSSFGPVWHTYDMKPQIAAPGGHILSTWPLGVLGSYCILSGTSMANAISCSKLRISEIPVSNSNHRANKGQVADKCKSGPMGLQHCYSFRHSSARSWSGQRLQCNLL